MLYKTKHSHIPSLDSGRLHVQICLKITIVSCFLLKVVILSRHFYDSHYLVISNLLYNYSVCLPSDCPTHTAWVPSSQLNACWTYLNVVTINLASSSFLSDVKAFKGLVSRRKCLARPKYVVRSYGDLSSSIGGGPIFIC